MMAQKTEKPLSVEQIVQRAGSTDFDPQYKLEQWFRTCQVMRKQANIYEHEGNDQEAYSILFRYARLVLEDLPKHPDAKDIKYRAAWKETTKGLQLSLAKLENLKPRINRRYDSYNERIKTRKAQRDARVEEHQRSSQDGKLSQEAKRRSLESPSHSDDESEEHYGATVRIDPTVHSDMAVDLANNEIRRRILGSPRNNSNSDGGAQELSQRLVDTRRKLDRDSHIEPQNSIPISKTNSIPSLLFNYPTVPQKSERLQLPELQGTLAFRRPPNAPIPPPKDFNPSHSRSKLIQSSSPSIPEKIALESPTFSFSRISSIPSPNIPEPQFAFSSYLENGSPLRTIFLPSKLRNVFLNIASPNTKLNRETMGLLCGTLIRNALFISKLVIPEQHSTSDTCEMEDEESLLEYCEAQPEGLWTLGWIHTHPTQTCFMSSRDLHTHMGYQRTLIEAIAIVCAPTKSPDWGIFRLTDPPGMGSIARCKLPGLFHPHDETKLYTDALGRPGHVIENKGLNFEVVDLRDRP